MGALLESGLVGNIGLKHLKVIKEDTINKWDKLGFLEGLKGHVKENMAQLYENQASHLINEAASSDSSGSFETVVFPIVRRVFSKLLANDIVSVQAMNLPIGKLFFFVPKIQDRVNGEHSQPYGAPGMTGGTADNYGGKNLYDRFYEGDLPGEDPEGLFDYSKGKFEVVNASSVVNVAWDSSTGDLAAYDYSTNGDEHREVIVKVSGFSADGQGRLIGPDGNAMDTEEFLSSLTVTLGGDAKDFRVLTQKYGKGIVQYGSVNRPVFPDGPGGSFKDICDQDGIIYLGVDTSELVAVGTTGSTDGYSGSTFNSNPSFAVSWKVYETLEFEDAIGEVSFDLESVTVSVTERKLRAQWSPELAQDVSAFHNIDAEAELTALLSEQVAA
jgi:hypothetical protein